MIAVTTTSDADVAVILVVAVVIGAIVMCLSYLYYRAREARRFRDRLRQHWSDHAR